MIFINLRGQEVKVKKAYKYTIDWDAKSLSKVQARAKKIIQKYWDADIVYEEFPVAGTRLRFDFYNASKKIVVEINGAQHNTFNKHFHANSREKFLNQLKRDDQKFRFCELNGIRLIEIGEKDNIEEEFLKQLND